MKYTITLQRKIEKTTIDSLLVVITEDYNEYSIAMINLINMFERNGTLVETQQFKSEEITRLYIEYCFRKEQ